VSDRLTLEADDDHVSPHDSVRYKHDRTAKGWRYETSVTIHRLPGEDGRAWIARSALALKDARRVAEAERDERDHADARRGIS
jgi:hypothetical protein